MHHRSPLAHIVVAARSYTAAHIPTFGVLLQTQLRSQVLSKLQRQQCNVHAALPSGEALWRSVMNSLVVDYLTACHYHYTLSVFQPEASLSGLQALDHNNILQLMHIGADSPLQAALSKRGAFDASAEGVQPSWDHAPLLHVTHSHVPKRHIPAAGNISHTLHAMALQHDVFTRHTHNSLDNRSSSSL